MNLFRDPVRSTGFSRIEVVYGTFRLKAVLQKFAASTRQRWHTFQQYEPEAQASGYGDGRLRRLMPIRWLHSHLPPTTSTLAVKSRVGWRQTGFIINFLWEVRVDQVGWNQFVGCVLARTLPWLFGACKHGTLPNPSSACRSRKTRKRHLV